jgi:hypothetical protein
VLRDATPIDRAEAAQCQIAAGRLDLIPLPAPPREVEVEGAQRHLLMAVLEPERPSGGGREGGSVSFLLQAGTVFSAEGARLTFPLPEELRTGACSEVEGWELADTCVLLFSDFSWLEVVVSELLGYGYSVRWTANAEARWAADGVNAAGSAISEVIKVGASVAAAGVKAAGEAVQRSEILAPEHMEMPAEAREVASAVRSATCTAAKVSGKAIDGLSSAIGWAARRISEQLPDVQEQWQEDVKVVGLSSLEAGASVWGALQEASTDFWKEVADTSAGVIGHKYGPEAGSTARDGMHAVGNVLEVKAYVSKRACGKILAAKSTKHAIGNADESHDEGCHPGSSLGAADRPAAEGKSAPPRGSASCAEGAVPLSDAYY